MKADEEDKEIYEVMKQLDEAFADSPTPPPGLDEALGDADEGDEVIDDLERERRQRDFLASLAGHRSLGSLIRGRRQALGFDLFAVVERCGWQAEEIESIEHGDLDLHFVPAARLAALLAALQVPSLGVLERPVRDAAREHLAVYESGTGPVFSRVRKGVSTFKRRESLLKGRAGIDEEATAHAADIYVRELSDKIEEFWANRSS